MMHRAHATIPLQRLIMTYLALMSIRRRRLQLYALSLKLPLPLLLLKPPLRLKRLDLLRDSKRAPSQDPLSSKRTRKPLERHAQSQEGRHQWKGDTWCPTTSLNPPYRGSPGGHTDTMEVTDEDAPRRTPCALARGVPGLKAWDAWAMSSIPHNLSSCCFDGLCDPLCIVDLSIVQ